MDNPMMITALRYSFTGRAKFNVLSDGILHSAERSRLIELVQRLPELTVEEIRLLNLAVSDTYLVENQLEGIF